MSRIRRLLVVFSAAFVAMPLLADGGGTTLHMEGHPDIELKWESPADPESYTINGQKPWAGDFVDEDGDGHPDSFFTAASHKNGRNFWVVYCWPWQEHGLHYFVQYYSIRYNPDTGEDENVLEWEAPAEGDPPPLPYRPGD